MSGSGEGYGVVDSWLIWNFSDRDCHELLIISRHDAQSHIYECASSTSTLVRMIFGYDPPAAVHSGPSIQINPDTNHPPPPVVPVSRLYAVLFPFLFLFGTSLIGRLGGRLCFSFSALSASFKTSV